jgi:hypothetical protein
MVYNRITGVFGLCMLFDILETRKNWIWFHSQVMGEAPTLLDLLERGNLNEPTE